MTHEADFVGEDIIPYLIHFSEKDIIPKIIDVEGGIIKTKRIKGPRLCDMLKGDSDISRLTKIYEGLGFRVGHISRHGIFHSDLHTGNVVVKNDIPFLIDWGKAKIMPTICENPEKTYQFWKRFDSEHLLTDTVKNLKNNSPDAYSKLEHAYLANFRKEVISPLDASYRDIEHRAYELYGVI
jgi:tRNA A-37 threonylcarbamoyl transferase component Bud32